MTPIRRQYLKIKQRYPDALLLFRLGDFYETFDEDSHIAAEVLDIVLTSRSMGKDNKIPMAGNPGACIGELSGQAHQGGVQGSDLRAVVGPGDVSRGLVERDVVRVVTPGTVVESSLLEQTSNNYLASLTVSGETGRAGVRGCVHGGVCHHADGRWRRCR